MALINSVKREINAKLVYYGPGLSGKSTNLNLIFSKLKPEFRGELKSMPIQNDKMFFFDFTPPGEGKVNGYNVRLHIYTLKGETAAAANWKMVLKGADGIVFVADSNPERMAANQESLANLESFVAAQGKELADIPLVFAYNKRDLAGAMPIENLQHALNPGKYPGFAITATKGEGVLNVLLSLVKGVLKNLRETVPALDGGADAQQEPTEEAMGGTSGSSAEGVPAAAGEEFSFEAESDSLSPAAPTPEVRIGGVEVSASGVVRIPLVITVAGTETKLALNLSVTPD